MPFTLHPSPEQPANAASPNPAAPLDEAGDFLRLIYSSPEQAELYEAMLDRKADREVYEAAKAEARSKNEAARHPRGALTRRRLYHSLEVVRPNLRDLNRPTKDGANPCGIFMAVAKFSGERAEYESGGIGAPLQLASSVVRWDRVAVDIDDKDLTPDQRRARREELLARLVMEGAPPSAVVITSGEKCHLWWALSDALDPAVGNELMKFLTSSLDGDAAASLATQVLRVPGFLHWKSDPQSVRLDAMNSSGLKHKPTDLIAVIRRITGHRSPKARKASQFAPGVKPQAAARGLNADLTDGVGGAASIDDLVHAIDFLAGHPSKPLGEHQYHEWRDVLSACCVAIVEQPGAEAKILPRMPGWLAMTGRLPHVHEDQFRGLMAGTQAKLANGEQKIVRPATVFWMALNLGWRPPVPVEVEAAAAWRSAAQFMDGSEDDLGRAVQLLEFLKGGNPTAAPHAAALAVIRLRESSVAPELVTLFASHYGAAQ